MNVTERASVLYLARAAQSLGRYKDMCKCMRTIASFGAMNEEERHLFVHAFKSYINLSRDAWRKLEHDHSDDIERNNTLIKYQIHLAQESAQICHGCIHLVKQLLEQLDNASNNSYATKIVYYRMLADCYRYIIEGAHQLQQQSTTFEQACALYYYQEAMNMCKERGERDKRGGVNDTMLLEVVFNYTLLLCNHMGQLARGIQIAYEALKRVEQQTDASTRTQSLIFSMQRNINVWEVELSETRHVRE